MKSKANEVWPLLPIRCKSSFDSTHGEDPEEIVAGSIKQLGLAFLHSLFINEHNHVKRRGKSKGEVGRSEVGLT